MKTPKTIRISKLNNESRKHRPRKNIKSGHKSARNLNNKKHDSRTRNNRLNEFRRRDGKTQKRNHKRVQRGGTSALPTVLVNIYDSMAYGISNFVNVLQGVEETVSPLPYLDHFKFFSL